MPFLLIIYAFLFVYGLISLSLTALRNTMMKKSHTYVWFWFGRQNHSTAGNTTIQKQGLHWRKPTTHRQLSWVGGVLLLWDFRRTSLLGGEYGHKGKTEGVAYWSGEWGGIRNYVHRMAAKSSHCDTATLRGLMTGWPCPCPCPCTRIGRWRWRGARGARMSPQKWNWRLFVIVRRRDHTLPSGLTRIWRD